MKKIRTRRTIERAAAPHVLWILLACSGCISERSSKALFETIPASSSNVTFSNDLTFTTEFNIYTYKDFYAGGGVALGDVNNDGLLDIYFVANQNQNRLYINRGNFRFEDITEKAGVGGSKPWSTGVSMADVNGDGLQDIYVTNAGHPDVEQRENELFINNGDLTFTERAHEFGLADGGYSIHASFFDYDNDGRLDMYLLNNYASKPISRYNPQALRRETPYFEGGDRLYHNEGDIFRDVTEHAGIYSSEAGFGLGVSVGDLNRDGWMDIYISNDFFERDYLYMNSGDGTFKESLVDMMSSISTTSMGGDISDLDNDGFPEVFVSDMLPESEERLKTVSDFVDWDRYMVEVASGYHRKFARNTLQHNNGDETFSEVGRYAGVEATDWSWGALIADFNLDGLRDIFVPNGFYKDVTDKDHLINMVRSGAIQANNEIDYKKLVELTPSVPLSNYMFESLGELRFANRAAEWGLNEPGFSNGAAYGDLDGDGDLDLVVNNVNMKSFIYRNRAAELYPERSWIQLVLEGEPPNTSGVGAQVELEAQGRRWYAEQMPQRGFQSSVDPTLHVGLGSGVSVVETLRVRWPNGAVSIQTDVKARQRWVVRQGEAGDPAALAVHTSSARGTGYTSFSTSTGYTSSSTSTGEEGALLADLTDEIGIDWKHEESSHDDFAQSPLLFHMLSTEGPAFCSGDLNGDRMDDLYVGGARDQPGVLLVQGSDGRFRRTHQPALEVDRVAEDVDCEFFDADGDGISELFVASGSSEFAAGSEHLADRLYKINPEGELVRLDDALPPDRHTPTGVVRAADMDGDGDQDLFVGTRMALFGVDTGYGVPVGGVLFENDGAGRFADATDRIAPGLRAQELRAAGVTDAEWGDLNGDGTPDLIVAGEWMPLTVFFNRGGRLERADSKAVGLDDTSGWWQSLALADLNGDGVLDLVGGNHGLNSHFRASRDRPMEMWAGDFNRSGKIEQIFASYDEEGGPYPEALRQNLIQQLPYLASRYPTFADYAGTTVTEMFSREDLEKAEHYRAEQLASVIGWNNGEGSFRIETLPWRAQLAPVYGILAEDVDDDGIPEILIGGNLHAAKPQAGRYDAGYGLMLRQDSAGTYSAVHSKESGFFSPGEIRGIQSLQINGRTHILVARNNDGVQAFGVRASEARRDRY